MEKRPNLFVVDGNEIIIPEPNEEQLLALAAERVGGNVTPEEFLDYPEVREAMVQLFKKQELAKAKTLLAAEKAAKKKVLESYKNKLLADLAQNVAGSVPVTPAPVIALETTAVEDKTVIDRPTTPIIRPPMPELKQGEVLSDHRALVIAQEGKDPQFNIVYHRFVKPEHLLQYKDSTTGNWWCMVTGRQVPEDSIRVVSAILVCEKSHAERLAKKLVDPRGKEQHAYSVCGTLDWLQNLVKTMSKPTQLAKPAQKPNTPVPPKKSPERLAEEEKIRVAVGAINSVEELVSDGLRLLHLHQPDCWQFRCTQAMLSNIASGLITQFEAELPERFPNRGATAELQRELDSVLEKKRAAKEGSFKGFLFHRLAGVLIRHREALQKPMSAPGSVGKKHKPDKAKGLRQHALSLGIDPTGKTEDRIRFLINEREQAKSRLKQGKSKKGQQ